MLDLRDEVVTWQQMLSSDVLKQNISHAGGANECTVTTLFAAFFLRYKALYQIFALRGNLGARTAEPLAATRNLRTARQSSRVHRRASSYAASSVIDASSGAVSMTLARRFIGVHAWS